MFCVKNGVCWLISTPRRGMAFALGILAAGALAFAYMAQHLWDVQPCVLCTYQRYVMVALIIAAFTGFITQKKFFMGLYALIIAAGLGIAGYHVGVEQHWWKGPDACSVSVEVNKSGSQADLIAAFKAKMLRLEKKKTLVRCDEVNWRILGVSATIWTFLLYVGMLGFVGAGYVCRKRHESK